VLWCHRPGVELPCLMARMTRAIASVPGPLSSSTAINLARSVSICEASKATRLGVCRHHRDASGAGATGMRKVDDPLRKLVKAWHSGTLRPQREGNALRTSHLCARKLRISANPQKCGDGPGQSVRSLRYNRRTRCRTRPRVALTGHRPRSRRVLPLGFTDERTGLQQLFCG
jgi:hypothetical protein